MAQARLAALLCGNWCQGVRYEHREWYANLGRNSVEAR